MKTRTTNPESVGVRRRIGDGDARRRLRLGAVAAGVAAVVLLLSGCGAGGGGADDGVQPPVTGAPPTGGGNNRTVVGAGVKGCYHPSFAGVQQGQFGCGIRNSSGDRNFDMLLSQEISLQQQFFGDYLTQIYLFDECNVQNANAFATPNRLVLMGLWLMRKIVFETGSSLPIAGVMAHEMGHRLQFENGWMVQTEPTVRRTELEADMWSGLYMAFAKSYAGPQINSYFQLLFSLGDYNFHDRGHHGTPNQRLAAGAVGFEVARAVANRQIPSDARVLHDVFVREVDRLVRTVGTAGVDAAGAEASPPLKQLDGEAAELAALLDRAWIDGVAAGERSLEEKDAIILSEADRQALVPYH